MIEHPDIRLHEGDEIASPALFAKLCGITEEEVVAEFNKHRDALGRYLQFDFPKHWIRGAKEVQARYGTRDAAALVEAVSPSGWASS